MGVVLREAANSKQPVEHAGALVAVHRSQFAETHRKVAVAALPVRVNQDVERAVHRLELVFGVVQLHPREHVRDVKVGVAGGLPQVEARDVRRVDQRITALQILVAHPVFELFADDAALGMEEDQAGAGQFLNAEQVQFLAQLAVVAFLGLFDLFEVLVQVLLGKERGSVDALQLLVVFVALPVGAGDRKQLERLDLRSVGNVRAAAEVDEVGTQRVFGEYLAGALIDQLALHPGLAVLSEALLLARIDPFVREVSRLDLPHLLLDLLEIFRGERNGAIEIVVKPVVDRRTDPELGVRIEFEHRGSQQVRGRVAIDFERFGILAGEDLYAGVRFDRPRQVVQLSVDLRNNGSVRQPGADRFSDLDGRNPRCHRLFAAVGQSDLDVTHREISA